MICNFYRFSLSLKVLIALNYLHARTPGTRPSGVFFCHACFRLSPGRASNVKHTVFLQDFGRALKNKFVCCPRAGRPVSRLREEHGCCIVISHNAADSQNLFIGLHVIIWWFSRELFLIKFLRKWSYMISSIRTFDSQVLKDIVHANMHKSKTYIHLTNLFRKPLTSNIKEPAKRKSYRIYM